MVKCWLKSQRRHTLKYGGSILLHRRKQVAIELFVRIRDYPNPILVQIIPTLLQLANITPSHLQLFVPIQSSLSGKE
jgi:hypothetical protein